MSIRAPTVDTSTRDPDSDPDVDVIDVDVIDMIDLIDVPIEPL